MRKTRTKTDRIIQSASISNKAFKRKYGLKSKKAIIKTKKQRQQWWRDLTSEQQGEYIEKQQAKKAKWRSHEPPRVLKYSSKYPWRTEGVNDKNRAQWLAVIHKKNPWLKTG